MARARWTQRPQRSDPDCVHVIVGGPVRGITFEVVKFTTQDGRRCVQCWVGGGCLFESLDSEYCDYPPMALVETVVDCREGLAAAGLWDRAWDRRFD